VQKTLEMLADVATWPDLEKSPSTQGHILGALEVLRQIRAKALERHPDLVDLLGGEAPVEEGDSESKTCGICGQQHPARHACTPATDASLGLTSPKRTHAQMIQGLKDVSGRVLEKHRKEETFAALRSLAYPPAHVDPVPPPPVVASLKIIPEWPETLFRLVFTNGTTLSGDLRHLTGSIKKA
jgi:hypothetical protein